VLFLLAVCLKMGFEALLPRKSLGANGTGDAWWHGVVIHDGDEVVACTALLQIGRGQRQRQGLGYLRVLRADNDGGSLERELRLLLCYSYMEGVVAALFGCSSRNECGHN